MKKMILASTILVAALIFGGCTDKSKPGNSGAVPAVNEKSGDTVKTGVISAVSGSYFLAEPGQTPKEIESYVVDLGEYVGQTVTVTGQYSGDTLFVGAIK